MGGIEWVVSGGVNKRDRQLWSYQYMMQIYLVEAIT